MPSPKDIYVHCDELEHIPKPNRDNWLYEMKLLQEGLLKNTKILQIGSMDGTRIIHLLKVRPDLKITGLEIESDLVNLAKQKVSDSGLRADFVHGDITKSPLLGYFDYVICLNNTLGYIQEEQKVIENMKQLGNITIISVYGEKFDDKLAYDYFKSIKLEIRSIEGNCFVMQDFTTVKRYTKEEVDSWSAKIIETPIGYFCIMQNICNSR